MERDKIMNISRRGFFKAAAVVGAALTIQPTLNKVKAANVVGWKKVKTTNENFDNSSAV